jgi:hypothetical protein
MSRNQTVLVSHRGGISHYLVAVAIMLQRGLGTGAKSELHSPHGDGVELRRTPPLGAESTRIRISYQEI